MPYCEHCGAYLEEGQHCTCQASQNPASAPNPDHIPPQEPQPEGGSGWQTTTTQTGATPPPPHQAGPAQPSKFSATLKNALPFLKAYWHSPAQATQSAVGQKDWMLAALLCVVQAVAAILAFVTVFLRLNQLIASIFSFLAFFGGDELQISPALSIPYGLLATVLGVGLMTVMLFVLTKLMKSESSFLDAFIACGVNTIPVTILLLLAFLVGLVSFGLGLGLLVMVLPVSAATGLISARQLCPDRETGLFWTGYLVGVMLVAGVTWFLFSNLLF